MTTHGSDSSSGHTFLAFLLGAALGAGTALLLAPQSGRETRRSISETTDEALKTLQDKGELLSKKSQKIIEDGKNSVETLKGEVNKLYEEGKKSVSSVRGEISKLVEEGARTIRDTVKEEMSALEKELSSKKKSS